MSVEQSQKYEYVKDAVLRGYQLNPEAYGQKFRNCQRDNSQRFVEFARVKEQLFDRWCHSKKVNKCFEKLWQLILIEEFKRRIPFHMKTFIDEKQVKKKKIQQDADLADEYFLTHGNINQQRSQPSDKQYTTGASSRSHASQQPVNSTQSIRSNSETPVCNYCKKCGHLRSECFYLIGTHDVQQPSASGHVAPMQLVSDLHSAAIIPCETGLAILRTQITLWKCLSLSFKMALRHDQMTFQR